MAILALEFSSAVRSVAVLEQGRVSRASEQGRRETRAFALIDSALSDAGLSREAVTCIAVGVGPGSYAGIRIGIAIALGWRLAREVRVLAFSSADCVARQFQRNGPFTIVIDAQRGEFFAARYERHKSAASLLEPFRRLTEADWQRAQGGEPFIRPDTLEADARWHVLVPDAGALAEFAAESKDAPTLPLEPLYLRPAEFVKAPAPRVIPG